MLTASCGSISGPDASTTARCHPPLPRNPSHPLPYPHAHPPAPDRTPTPPADARQRAATVPGGCFTPPFLAPFPYLQIPAGCSPVVSRPIRLLSAPSGSNPRPRYNPQAAPPLARPFEGTNPSCAQPCRATTSIQPQSCIGRGRGCPRHGGPEKTRDTKRIESNPRSPGRAAAKPSAVDTMLRRVVSSPQIPVRHPCLALPRVCTSEEIT